MKYFSNQIGLRSLKKGEPMRLSVRRNTICRALIIGVSLSVSIAIHPQAVWAETTSDLNKLDVTTAMEEVDDASRNTDEFTENEDLPGDNQKADSDTPGQTESVDKPPSNEIEEPEASPADPTNPDTNKASSETGDNLSNWDFSRDGTYTIDSAITDGKSVDVKGNSSSNGTTIQSYDKNHTDAQAWSFIEDDQGYTTIYHVSSGKVLDVSEGKAFDGAKVQLWTSNGTLAQKWIITLEGSLYKIVSALNSKFVLDLTGGSASNGTKLQLWTDNGTKAQRWSFRKTTSSRDWIDDIAKANRNSLEDGTFIFNGLGYENLAIDAAGNGNINGTSVQLWSKNSTDAQVWKISHDLRGYTIIQNAASLKSLDVPSADAKSETMLQLWEANDTWAQKWIAVKNPDGSITLLSALNPNLAIDIQWNRKDNGTPIWLYTKNNSQAQKWLVSAGKTERMRLDELAKNYMDSIGDGDYGIRSSLLPLLVMDACGGGVANGTKIQSYNANGSMAQVWRISHDQNGYVTITNLRSGKVLDVTGGLK